MIYLFIFLLAGVGALLRFIISVKFNASGFPWGTLTVNVLGSLILGVFVFFAAHKDYIISKDLHLALCVGLLGSLTTFSTFNIEVFEMLGAHKFFWAGSYVLGSLGGSLFLVFLSYSVMNKTFL